MTNYNERLTTELVKLQGRDINDWEGDLAKAKQAITSLIKELVAEVKPDELKESDYTLNMGVPHNPPSNTTRTNLYRKGYNDSLDQFEQKLLKALEEV